MKYYRQALSRIALLAALLLASPPCAPAAPGPKKTGELMHEAPPASTEYKSPIPTSGNEVKTGQFYFPRLQFQLNGPVADKWDAHPIGDQKVRDALKKFTNINVLTDPVVVNLDHPDELCRYPFVFMTAEGTFTLSQPNRAALREYLLRGGFLYADDCVVDQWGDFFFIAFIKEINAIFPENQMKPIPDDHEIFNCYFKIKGNAPFLQGKRHPAMGLFDKETGRLMCMVTSGDVHCGWVGFGNLNQATCKEAIKMGVNICVYCLTH